MRPILASVNLGYFAPPLSPSPYIHLDLPHIKYTALAVTRSYDKSRIQVTCYLFKLPLKGRCRRESRNNGNQVDNRSCGWSCHRRSGWLPGQVFWKHLRIHRKPLGRGSGRFLSGTIHNREFFVKVSKSFSQLLQRERLELYILTGWAEEIYLNYNQDHRKTFEI